METWGTKGGARGGGSPRPGSLVVTHIHLVVFGDALPPAERLSSCIYCQSTGTVASIAGGYMGENLEIEHIA